MFAFCMSKRPTPKRPKPTPKRIRLPLPPEVILRINKYMSSPTSRLIQHLPLCTRDCTRDWNDYDERVLLYKKYKFFCYDRNCRPILFPTHWKSTDCQIFLEVVPYM